MIERKGKVVLCHGVFDLLHIGHIKHLRKAKSLGDYLIVSITGDAFVERGNGRPLFNEKIRKEALEALECVDEVVITNHSTAVPVIMDVKPDIYVKDIEYKYSTDERFIEEKKAVDEVGGSVSFTSEDKYSSSHIINRGIFDDAIIKYLDAISSRYSVDDIFHHIDNMQNMRVLVIGETIIDEYCFGKHMGKMRHDAISEFIVEGKEKYLGGAASVAKHISDFVSYVMLNTVIGDNNSEDDFIRGEMSRNVCTGFVRKKNTITPVKIRYIEEQVGNRNLFKVSILDDHDIDVFTEDVVYEILYNILPTYDVVIVSDYGHGMLTSKLRDIIMEKSNFLAVNTQVNTENRGFNTIDKYHGMDVACINEEELRIMAKSKYGNIDVLAENTRNNIGAVVLIVTMGMHGCKIYSEDNIYSIPAISPVVVDAMGAGDAFFAIASIVAGCGAPIDIVGFMGAVAGGMHTSVMGNRSFIRKKDMCKQIEVLLK